MNIKKSNMDTKELTELFYKLQNQIDILFEKQKSSESINFCANLKPTVEYKYEEDNIGTRMFGETNYIHYVLSRIESGFNNEGIAITKKTYPITVPVHELNLVPEKTKVKHEKAKT